MLTDLRIKNLALVNDLAIQLGSGYNSITGENILSVILLNGATAVMEQTGSIRSYPNVCANDEHVSCRNDGVTDCEGANINPS